MTNSTGFIRHIQNCTKYDPSIFIPFIIDEKEVGFVLNDIALQISEESGFQIINDKLVLSPITASIEARTYALKHVSDLLSDKYNISLEGEIYPVIQKFGDIPLAHIDRAAIPWFGVKGFGVHVNGFVRKKNDIFMWIGQRSKSRKNSPEKLDNMIGGGLPLGYSIEENLEKEAWEEAGLKPNQVSNAKFIHSLSYKVEMMKGLRNDNLFIFDLEMPEDIIPKNTDGEVDHFELIPAKDVMEIIYNTNRFKFNCNIVIIDFLIRHNILEENIEEYKNIYEDLIC